MSKTITLSKDIAIDLGTATVQVYTQGVGIVAQEPSVVAIDNTTDRVIKVGKEAQEMMGRTPDGIIALRPLKDGSINDYDVTMKMLQYFIRRAYSKALLPPRLMVSGPAGINELEKTAVYNAAKEAGARKVYLIEAPIAAALGAGLNIKTAIGNMTVDIGGGVTEIAVISLGGIVIHDSVKVGGDSFDEAIIQYVKDNYNMLIGERTAEGVKMRIGEVYAHDEARLVEVKGRDLSSGMPKVITLSSKEMIGAMYAPMTTLIDGICGMIERTPPELVGDILHNGIILVGGGSKLRGLDRLIQKVTGIKTAVAKDPDSCVALGMGVKLGTLNKYTFDDGENG